MGLLEDPASEPETPPPSWSPAKPEFWRKPSKWQICMPRLRLIVKVFASFVGFIILIKLIGHPPPKQASPPPEAPRKHQTDNEMKASYKQDNWLWKGFTQ
jgi:hypothetical protein